jgi:hypothetical protein
MFQREFTDPSLIPENPLGMVKIRLADIWAFPELKLAESTVNRACAEVLRQDFQSSELPPFALGSIDVCYGTAQLSSRHDPNADDQPNRVLFGMGDAFVGFKQPANSQAWLAKYAPASETGDLDGLPFMYLARIPAIGPMRLTVANRDAHTVCLSHAKWSATEDQTEYDSAESLGKSVKHRV